MTEELNASPILTENGDTTNNVPENTQEFTKDYSNRDDILTRLAVLINMPIEDSKEEVDFLKQLYYKLRKSEIETQKESFLAQAGNEDDFVIDKDILEEKLKLLLNDFKVKKATLQEEKDRLKKENLQKKQAILDQLKAKIEDSDNINKHYTLFTELQHQFKEINDVPAANVSELWKQFQSLTESFYDLLKINKELRDYDFKKNLEKKEALISEAEKLAESDNDIVGSIRKLPDRHDEWLTTGPVSSHLIE